MGQSSGMKRRTSDSDDEMEVSENVTDSTSPKKVKKNKTTEEGQTSPNNTYNLANYFPFNEENGVACLIKTYEDTEKHGLVLNDVVEVVGFLSLNPALEATWEDTDIEDKATHPPPSLVPRIHAIAIKKLKHCNPLLQQNILYDNILEQAEAARSDLLLIFTQLLFEDSIAAEYLLCHLLSRVYIRNEGHTIGKFSLNLYNVKHNMFGSYVNNILQTLVTHSHYLPLSIELLNDSCFTPKKDYESNRLWSAALQLPDDTLLILDETSMSEGQLKNQGCLNVLALQRLFRDQEIQYDFGYYPVTYNTNIQLLVISEGKSMFDADIKLNMRSNSVSQETLTESYEAVRIYLTEEVINKLRNYLTAVRLLDFELGEDMVKKIGEDYVTMRQQNEQVNSSDLHTLLVFSRLLALSHGRKHMIAEDWSRAVELETERKARFA
ncbi:hypothetical protein RUM44_001015 [Polyplax serrata]|uniref:Mini-chromosome maintenance complex-binding protein n=1 Tax=Polyplax serrata TaxID=468196 RepID=A0ABR1B997_POLSC